MSARARKTNEAILAATSCTIPEAMQVLELDRKTIQAMCLDKRLHSFPVGRFTRIGVASIKRLVGIETP